MEFVARINASLSTRLFLRVGRVMATYGRRLRTRIMTMADIFEHHEDIGDCDERKDAESPARSHAEGRDDNKEVAMTAPSMRRRRRRRDVVVSSAAISIDRFIAAMRHVLADRNSGDAILDTLPAPSADPA